MACGLRLLSDDGETLPDEMIHQGGLSDIGIADDVYEPCLMVGAEGGQIVGW